MTVLIPFLLLSVIIALYILKKYDWFIALACLYLVMPIDMITPFIEIGSHYLLLLTMLVIVFIEYKKKNIYIGGLTLKFIMTWACVFIVYLIAYLINGKFSAFLSAAIKFIGIVAFASEVILLITLTQLLDKEKQIVAFKRFIIIFVSITAVFVLLQIYASNIGIPLTKSIMHSESLNVLTRKGFVTRALGITPSPVMLAALLLMVISIMLAFSIKNKVPAYYYLLICFIGFIAMLTNTKTFILGLPLAVIVSIILVLLAKKTVKQKLLQIFTFLICLIVIFGSWFFFIPERIHYVRNSYIAYLGPNISDILDTRKEVMLDSNIDNEIEEGILTTNDNVMQSDIQKSSGQVIKENWLIGVGPEPVSGEYFSDMSYIAILHNGGVIAFAVFLVFYLYLFIKAVKKRSFIIISSLAVTAAIFLTFSWYINCTYVPFITFTILILQHNVQMESIKQNSTSKLPVTN